MTGSNDTKTLRLKIIKMDEAMNQKALDRLRQELRKKQATTGTMEKLDALISRRSFMGSSLFAGLSVSIFESTHAWKGLFGRGLIPVSWAEEAHKGLPEKHNDMLVHTMRPINGEPRPYMLDDEVTPTDKHFVRNNGLIPPQALSRDAKGWRLGIQGQVEKELSISLDELKSMPSIEGAYLIECGGNGRALFEPPVRGNQWERGAVSCSLWKGVPLSHLLDLAGLKKSAIYTAHYGADIPLGKAQPFSRGIPLEKALMKHTIVAYEMNGQPIPPEHGFPVRLVVPGWIGSCSQKWLNRIVLLDHVHDAKKMTGYSYRVPKYPTIPGEKPPKSDMEIATAWKIKSLITAPMAESFFDINKDITVRGHAWAGERDVSKVQISLDYGLNWKECSLRRPRNKYGWYHFEHHVKIPKKGYYEIWARAYDHLGEAQPFRQPWNPKGYLGNVIHRVPIYVGVESHA